MEPKKFHLWIKYLILIASPIIIIITILVGIIDYGVAVPDYIVYEDIWDAFLRGENPYMAFQIYFDGEFHWVSCLYPLGFLGFSGFYFIHPLLPKVFFCLTWLATGVVVDEICIKNNVSNRATLVYVMGFIILSPIYLIATVLMGRYDSIVGLLVLLAVYSIHNGDETKSGIYTALAFLLKFIGLIILFPLVISKRKINWKLGGVAVVICIGLYLIGVLFWGGTVFDPFTSNLGRAYNSSFVTMVENFLRIDLSSILIYILISGSVIVILILYFINNDTSTYTLLTILCLMVILQTLYAHYTIWFIPLATYWTIKHKNALKGIFILYIFSLLVFGLTPFLSEDIMSINVTIFFLILIIFVFLSRDKNDEVKMDIQSDDIYKTHEKTPRLLK